MSRSSAEFKRLQRVLPGGVSSPVRAFRAVGGQPPVITRAQGYELTDADARTYVDYVGSWGSAIVGHAHPAVVEAVRRTAGEGLSFGLCSMLESQLAEEIVERVESVERVRFVNSGTEAVMSAVRVARAATGRSGIIKFDGCYHGHSDGLLARSGSGPATLSIPECAGVTTGAAGDTSIATYNDAGSVEGILSRNRGKIAAIIVEPIAGNMGVVAPEAGFLESLKEMSERYGALLIFDEVMTGFRVARGGAQDLLGVKADLTTFGKVIGGGLPVGAFGGRRELMEMLAPIGPVYQAGTFSGNPVVMAAGLATLSLLDAGAYQRLESSGARLQRGIEQALRETGARGVVQRAGSMLSVFFTDGAVRNMNQARGSDQETFRWLFKGLLERGVHLPPSGFETWFVSLGHDENAIDHTCRAVRETLGELRWAATPIGI